MIKSFIFKTKSLYTINIINIIMVAKMFKHKCLRCSWEWDSQLELPVACPRCKRYDWNEKKKEVK